MKTTPQWKGRSHGGKVGQKSLFYFFRFVNIYWGYGILIFVVPFYMVFSHKGFVSTWYYFRKIQGYGFLKSFWKTYLNHFIFGQTFIDKFVLFAGKKNLFKTSISGQEIFDGIINSNKGAIIASCHIGNFEISGYLLHQNQKRINAIISGAENPVIQQYRDKILSEHNVFPIQISDDMSHIFAINTLLSKGEILSMPCDRVFTGNKTATLDFIGHKAVFPTGAFHLAVKFEVPVITLFVLKQSSKHYNIIINRIDRFPEENLSPADKINILAQNYVEEIEKILKVYPEQWFNFYKFWN